MPKLSLMCLNWTGGREKSYKKLLAFLTCDCQPIIRDDNDDIYDILINDVQRKGYRENDTEYSNKRHREIDTDRCREIRY